MQENKVLFDTHVHLNNDFYAKDIENHIKEMITQGIKKMLCVGYDIPSSNKAISLSKKYPNLIYAAVGIHPTTLENHNQESLDQLELLLQKPEVYALGEIGLDYHWDSVEPMLQKEFFTKQIILAKKYHKPIVIHSREALHDTYDIIKKTDISTIGGIMHSYAGSYEMALEFIKLNMLISLSGVVTFKNARKTKEVAEKIPLTSLLIETDCPYLTPEPFRGQRNFPQYSYYVALEIARCKNIDVNDVMQQTYNNALSILKVTDENNQSN